MWLILNHPKWASRSCYSCRTWQYDGEGNIVRRPYRVGLPILREANSVLPCGICPKIPDSEPLKHWSNAIEVTDEIRQILKYYYRCQVNRNSPQDSFTEECAIIIFQAIEEHKRKNEARMGIILDMLTAIRSGASL